MPSGKTHLKISAIGAGGFIAIGALLSVIDHTIPYIHPYEAVYGIFAGVACLIGDLFLSPDLDGEYSDCKRRWGPLKVIWRVYEKFPHRSPTHWPFLGDAIRLLNVLVVVFGVSMVLGAAFKGLESPERILLYGFYPIYQMQLFVMEFPDIAIATAIGLSTNTLMHVIADISVSEAKKMVDFTGKKKKVKK